ncbi:MAG: glycine oxidase ThiO [Nitrospirae bacterium]|jgi:glycine oxidase|nr:glycine oxidase ThiO [Nitrospirota bacterium]
MDSRTTEWDIVIVGAGIIGCSIAWHLRKGPFRVLLVERSEPGGLATNAAAGILGPLNETSGPGPLLDLMQESLALYPSFVDDVQKASGLSADLVSSGILSVATSPEELKSLTARWQWQQSRGKGLSFLHSDEIRKEFPDLSPSVLGAIHYPHESHVFAPRLLKGLLGGLSRTSVSFRSGTSIRKIRPEGNGDLTAETSHGDRIRSRKIVLTPGAYLNEMEIPSPVPPVIPANGQILSVRIPDFPLRKVVFYPEKGYFVPKLDGTVVIGATEETVGFQTRVTPRGIMEFLAPLEHVCPRLLDAPLQLTWSGLRPKTPDGLPLLGPHPLHSNLIFATGHYRNGILLAPVTGQKIAALLQGKDLDDLRPFSPDRFV